MSKEVMLYKNKLYKELSRIGKGISNSNRLEILNLLCQSPKTVENIAKETGLSFANTSQHLQILKDSRLVKTERNGNYVTYSVTSYQVIELMYLLTSLGENELSEMRILQNEADKQEGVKTLSLKQAIMSLSNSFLLDVRPKDEYLAGHIDSAVNIPINDLPERLSQLPNKKAIIVYCRGRLCPNSNLATQLLNKNGFNAFSLNASYHDWQKLKATD